MKREGGAWVQDLPTSGRPKNRQWEERKGKGKEKAGDCVRRVQRSGGEKTRQAEEKKEEKREREGELQGTEDSAFGAQN